MLFPRFLFGSVIFYIIKLTFRDWVAKKWGAFGYFSGADGPSGLPLFSEMKGGRLAKQILKGD
jgi:hypothetical protein